VTKKSDCSIKDILGQTISQNTSASNQHSRLYNQTIRLG